MNAGIEDTAMNSLQLWNLLPVFRGRIIQAIPPHNTRPHVQNTDCILMYGPRYLLRVNSAIYGNTTGREPPTLEKERDRDRQMEGEGRGGGR